MDNERKMYTYGISMSPVLGIPSELGVETSCMPLPTVVGNATGVLVSVVAQQMFRVGIPDIEAEKTKVKLLLQALKDAADGGMLPSEPCI
jgi:hypothetical protein